MLPKELYLIMPVCREIAQRHDAIHTDMEPVSTQEQVSCSSRMTWRRGLSLPSTRGSRGKVFSMFSFSVFSATLELSTALQL